MGIRGIPANHGGFETFAEHLSIYLARHGWEIIVYCQDDNGGGIYEDDWNGIKRIHIPVKQKGTFGTIVFDYISTIHAVKEPTLVLTLGYNTAVFNVWYLFKGVTNIINMDGIEWRRKKWPWAAKIWFYINEKIAVWCGNHLVADHPEINKHLLSRTTEKKITTIAYGAHRIDSADVSCLMQYGLIPNMYAIIIARAEPENSILEMVRAWSRKPRGRKLVVLGKYTEDNSYHRLVLNCCSEEVLFLGAIYDTNVVNALRFYSYFYLHGHQVGGTNPSLVEALGAGNAVLAHDNRFNRWVAGTGARYFSDENEFSDNLEEILNDEKVVSSMRSSSLQRHSEAFTWTKILESYEVLLDAHLPASTNLENMRRA